MNPLYAILSGFEADNTPGVGTFYDFLNRLWYSDDNHMSSHIHPLKTKVKKPKTIHIVTYLYFLIFPMHQNMIHIDSCMFFQDEIISS